MTAFATAPALRNYWYSVIRSADLAPGPVRVRLLGEDLALFRDLDGRPAAVPETCPHRQAPLSAGVVVDGCLRCPYHGWTFDADGRCVRVPSSPESVPAPPKAHIRSYLTAERYGLVWVCLGEPVAGIPEIEQESDPSFRRLNVEVEEWRTAATRMVDNFLDISHFPYVHVGTFGTDTDPLVQKIDLESLGEYFGYQYSVDVTNDVKSHAASGVTAPVLTRRMSTGFALPLAVRSTILYETGLEHIILLLSTPSDDETSLFTFVIWRNDDFTVPADEILRFDRAIGAEDKRMLEQLQGSLPLDATSLVSVQSDKPSVEWRRRFAQLVAGEPR